MKTCKGCNAPLGKYKKMWCNKCGGQNRGYVTRTYNRKSTEIRNIINWAHSLMENKQISPKEFVKRVKDLV